MFSFFSKKRIYLDHASTTPLDPAVLRAMNQVYKNSYFNPGGLYCEGVSVSQKISESRKSVAKLLGTTSDHIIFTRGGTESINLAILGVIKKFQESNKGTSTLPHIIVSEIEHSAVLQLATNKKLENSIELSVIPVDANGIIDVSELKKALRTETILVSVMYVNNEIGTIQPIKEIAKLIRWYKKQKNQESDSQNKNSPYPIFHTDAIQAANYLELGVDQLGVDLMSLSGSKIYGPKSTGALYVRNRELVAPILHGGEQEFGLRAGTEDVASIIGFSKALQIARDSSVLIFDHLKNLQEYFFAELEKNVSDMRVNGSRADGERICNNINISISGISSERLVIELDAKGICASSKSACREDGDEESYVIAALRRHKPSNSIEGSIRFTMGRTTTKGDVDRTVQVLAEIVSKIRAFEAKLTNRG